MIQVLVRAFWALRSVDEGQTIVEYALVISLVSITAIAVLGVVGGIPGSFLTEVTADL